MVQYLSLPEEKSSGSSPVSLMKAILQHHKYSQEIFIEYYYVLKRRKNCISCFFLLYFLTLWFFTMFSTYFTLLTFLVHLAALIHHYR